LDVRSCHEQLIQKDVETVFKEFTQLDFSSSKLIKFLFGLRGLRIKEYTIKGLIKGMNFTEFGHLQAKNLFLDFGGSSKIEPVYNKSYLLLIIKHTTEKLFVILNLLHQVMEIALLQQKPE
jgi:hypothetical protein